MTTTTPLTPVGEKRSSIAVEDIDEQAAAAFEDRVRTFLADRYPSTAFQVSFDPPEEDDAGETQWLHVTVEYVDGPSHLALQALLDEEFALSLTPPPALEGLVVSHVVSLVSLTRSFSTRAWASVIIDRLLHEQDFAARLDACASWVDVHDLLAGPTYHFQLPDLDFTSSPYGPEVEALAALCAGLTSNEVSSWGPGLAELARWIHAEGLELARLTLAEAPSS